MLLGDIGRLNNFRSVGTRLTGPCPIHDGDNRQAFRVQRDRDLWFCFTRCQAGGDVIDLAWRLAGRSWARTARWLERLAGEPSTTQDLPSMQAIHRAAPRPPFCPYTRRLHLDPSHTFFKTLGLEEGTVRRFEAGAWHGPGFLAETVAVRLHDLQGNPLGYAGRRLDPDTVSRWGKWKWPTDYPKAQGLWNWHRVDPTHPEGLIVVEGPWSVMKLWQAGFGNAVALGGVSVSGVQRQLLSRARALIVFLDGDETGEQATARHVAARIHDHMEQLRPPRGVDPADLTEPQLVALLKRH